ncbi:unnamed protein product [Bursaphelenchus okinawaensis]|uniref:Serpin domain-containing protein n=1 Tax=Bursaphelenchus okinawaensis TaxID=465554 RepID=A0A811K963_9BILA|nr:unnamed protein product [Bursaphelenchus okinawaensis]CAG9095517.1 unnamed protein product [Bursaphelenchus okinawaensis]
MKVVIFLAITALLCESNDIFEYEKDLLKRTADKYNVDNVAISGFSILKALTLAYQGAEGGTKQEFLELLGDDAFESISNTESAFRSSQGMTLEMSDRAFLSNNINVKEEYESKLDDKIEKVDFSESSEAADRINDFVKNSTDGHIKTIFDANDLNGDTAFVLVNALYFNAEFVHKFSKKSTTNALFYPKAGVDKEVPMLVQKAVFPFLATMEAQILHLPYKGDAKLVLVVPVAKFGLDKLIQNLTTERLQEFIFGGDAMDSQELTVKLPKFTVEFSDDVKKQLQEIGLKKAFSPEADFSGLTDENVSIDQVKHKVFFKTDEQGTEAAAATAAHATRSFSPTIVADHPFIFFVVVKESILFSGFVRDIKS